MDEAAIHKRLACRKWTSVCVLLVGLVLVILGLALPTAVDSAFETSVKNAVIISAVDDEAGKNYMQVKRGVSYGGNDPDDEDEAVMMTVHITNITNPYEMLAGVSAHVEELTYGPFRTYTRPVNMKTNSGGDELTLLTVSQYYIPSDLMAKMKTDKLFTPNLAYAQASQTAAALASLAAVGMPGVLPADPYLSESVPTNADELSFAAMAANVFQVLKGALESGVNTMAAGALGGAIAQVAALNSSTFQAMMGPVFDTSATHNPLLPNFGKVNYTACGVVIPDLPLDAARDSLFNMSNAATVIGTNLNTWGALTNDTTKPAALAHLSSGLQPILDRHGMGGSTLCYISALAVWISVQFNPAVAPFNFYLLSSTQEALVTQRNEAPLVTTAAQASARLLAAQLGSNFMNAMLFGGMNAAVLGSGLNATTYAGCPVSMDDSSPELMFPVELPCVAYRATPMQDATITPMYTGTLISAARFELLWNAAVDPAAAWSLGGNMPGSGNLYMMYSVLKKWRAGNPTAASQLDNLANLFTTHRVAMQLNATSAAAKSAWQAAYKAAAQAPWNSACQAPLTAARARSGMSAAVNATCLELNEFVAWAGYIARNAAWFPQFVLTLPPGQASDVATTGMSPNNLLSGPVVGMSAMEAVFTGAYEPYVSFAASSPTRIPPTLTNDPRTDEEIVAQNQPFGSKADVVYTGADDLSKTWVIRKSLGRSSITTFSRGSSSANPSTPVTGSYDGTAFPPIPRLDVTVDDAQPSLTVFAPGPIYRPVAVDFKGETTDPSGVVSLWHYQLNAATGIPAAYNDQVYGLPRGMAAVSPIVPDVSGLLAGTSSEILAKVVFSAPYGFGVPRAEVEAVSPLPAGVPAESALNQETHGTFLDLEPMSGKIMNGALRMGAFLHMGPSAFYSKLQPVLMPTVWTERAATVSPSMAADFQENVDAARKLRNTTLPAALCTAGAVLAVAGGAFTWHFQKKLKKARQANPDLDDDEFVEDNPNMLAKTGYD